MIYDHTFQSEIFLKSDCINIELAVVNFLRKVLESSGYSAVDDSHFVYKKDSRHVYLAIVDSIEHLNYKNSDSFLDEFSSQDIIITDNVLHYPVNARVIKLPNSWYGIYSYTPSNNLPIPDRKLSCKMRRSDSARLEIFLELMMQQPDLSNVYASFDCADHRDIQSVSDKKENLINAWSNFPEEMKLLHKDNFDYLVNNIPYNNHNIEIDEVMHSSVCNLIAETYSGDHVIALSEKTFRALVTPRLWILFAGVNSVHYLKSIGFDILDDLINHNRYDKLKWEDRKIPQFVWQSLAVVDSKNWKTIEQRCIKAAEHNQNLLKEMKKQWPIDFVEWLNNIVKLL